MWRERWGPYSLDNRNMARTRRRKAYTRDVMGFCRYQDSGISNTFSAFFIHFLQCSSRMHQAGIWINYTCNHQKFNKFITRTIFSGRLPMSLHQSLVIYYSFISNLSLDQKNTKKINEKERKTSLVSYCSFAVFYLSSLRKSGHEK